MEAQRPSFLTRIAKPIRNLLLVAVVVMAVLLVASNRDGSAVHPFSIPEANAELISAAPGYLTLTVPAAGGNFYIIDSTRQIICVYQLDGEKIRLVSARDFNRDTDIVDSSIRVMGANNRPILIEGGNGIDAQTAAIYADGLKKWMDENEKKKR